MQSGRRAAPESAEDRQARQSWQAASRQILRTRGRELGVIIGALALVFVVLAVVPARSAPAPDGVPVTTALSKDCATTDPGALVASASSGTLLLTSNGVGNNIESPASRTVAAGTQRLTPTDAQAGASGGVFGGDGSTSWFSPCTEPRVDQVVQVPTGTVSLLLTNPDSDDAVVSVTLTGANGGIGADDLRDVPVPATTTVTLDLSGRLSGTENVGLRIRASQGRVSAVARAAAGSAIDYQDSTILARNSIVAALPSGASRVTLLLTNPDTVRTSAKVNAMGESGGFDPGAGTILIDPEHTIAVDVSGSVSAESAALEVSARSNIAVSAVVTMGDDTALIAGRGDTSIVAGDSALLALPAAGSLVVSNPGDQSIDVTVDWGAGQAPVQRQLAARASLALFTPQDAKTALVTATGRFVAGAALTAAGVTVIPANPVRAGGSDRAARPAVDLGR